MGIAALSRLDRRQLAGFAKFTRSIWLLRTGLSSDVLDADDVAGRRAAGSAALELRRAWFVRIARRVWRPNRSGRAIVDGLVSRLIGAVAVAAGAVCAMRWKLCCGAGAGSGSGFFLRRIGRSSSPFTELCVAEARAGGPLLGAGQIPGPRRFGSALPAHPLCSKSPRWPQSSPDRLRCFPRLRGRPPGRS